MKAAQYKKVREEILDYISKGKPIAAGHVMEQWMNQFTEKQYYELSRQIYTALSNP